MTRIALCLIFLLYSLPGCSPCILGDVCEAGIMQAVHATQTAEAAP